MTFARFLSRPATPDDAVLVTLALLSVTAIYLYTSGTPKGPTP